MFPLPVIGCTRISNQHPSPLSIDYFHSMRFLRESLIQEHILKSHLSINSPSGAASESAEIQLSMSSESGKHNSMIKNCYSEYLPNYLYPV